MTDGRKNRGSVRRGVMNSQQGTRELLPALCDVALCHICGATFISATGRKFAIPYICWDCRPASERKSDGVVSPLETKVSTEQEDQHGTDSA